MNRKKIIGQPFIFIPLCLVFACTSLSGGNTIRKTYDSYKKSSPDDKNTPTPQPGVYTPEPTIEPEEEENTLLITTVPAGALVYMNNTVKGITPVTFTDLEPGAYRITVAREGYYEQTFWVEYNGGRKEYNIVLREITGYLIVHCNVPDAEITVGNYTYLEAPLEMRIGSYILVTRAFGYDEYSEAITIYEKRTTEVEISLQEAVFALSDPRLSRPVFSPDNPGLLGTSTLFFRVTSYGKGSFIVKNAAGEEVYRDALPRFTTWEQAYKWNGRGTGNRELDDGIYTILIDAAGEKDGVSAQLVTTIRIDRSYVINFRIPWSGVSGLVYTATPDILPPFSFQLSGHVFISPDFFTSGTGASFTPVNTGIRLGLFTDSELDLVFSPVFIQNSEIVPFAVTGAWKQQLFSSGGSRGIRAAVTARGTYVYATNADINTNYTGFTMGLPLSLDSGVVSIILNPEFTLSPYRVIYGTAEDQAPSFHMWMYGKVGVVVDTGTVTAALSGSVRSFSFMDGFDINYPLNAALELNMLIPDTLLFFSAGATMEFINTAEYYINLGIGLSLLY